MGSRIDDLRFIFEKRDLIKMLWSWPFLSELGVYIHWFVKRCAVIHVCLMWCSTRWSISRIVLWFMWVDKVMINCAKCVVIHLSLCVWRDARQGDQLREVCCDSCLFDMVLDKVINCTKKCAVIHVCLIWCSTRWSIARSVLWFMFVWYGARQGDQLREVWCDSCVFDMVLGD